MGRGGQHDGAMMAKAMRPYDEHAVKNALLDHAFRATLHRMRGVQALLVGWAEIGAGDGDAPRLKRHYEECGKLLARLEWLHGARALDLGLERLKSGEAPDVLLAAAGANATPEELREGNAPRILKPDAALALALWLEAQRPLEETLLVRTDWVDGCFLVSCDNAAPTELRAWHKAWGKLLHSAEDGRLLFRRNAFAPQLAEAASAGEQ